MGRQVGIMRVYEMWGAGHMGLARARDSWLTQVAAGEFGVASFCHTQLVSVSPQR